MATGFFSVFPQDIALRALFWVGVLARFCLQFWPRHRGAQPRPRWRPEHDLGAWTGDWGFRRCRLRGGCRRGPIAARDDGTGVEGRRLGLRRPPTDMFSACSERVPHRVANVPAGAGPDPALRHARCSCPGAMPRMALSERCQQKRGIALTAERYAKYNTIGAEVDDSRPFQKLPNQCVMGVCRTTPTIRQSSARVAPPRLLELSRQVAVDFQPDADFDERRRCPGHGFLPFMDQYHRRSSAYPGSRRIQEIKIIAFVYGTALGLPATYRPTPSESLCRMPFPVMRPHGSPQIFERVRSGRPPIERGKHPAAKGNAWSPQRPRSLDHGCHVCQLSKRPETLLGCLRKEVMPPSPFAKAIPNFCRPAMLRFGRRDAISTRIHLLLDRRF
jgi:hypothetical protein